MAILNISEFSCLKEATLELAPVTVIIGPQGSGKSVTTKLFYFLSDILTNFVQRCEKGDSLNDYKRYISLQFCLWFPPSAWGQSRFNINYSAGPFSVRILRRLSQGKGSDEVTVTFSIWFDELYNRTLKFFAGQEQQELYDIDFASSVRDTGDRLLRVRDLVNRQISKDLGGEYLGQQTFIPAGRAFFTSIGRLVAGLGYAGTLDPVTIKFALLFANLRDRNSKRLHSRLDRFGPEFIEKRNKFMGQLFGGEVKYESEQEFVEATDGRKIPFSSLSSGQQELLPMWSLIDYFQELDAMRTSASGRNLIRRARELVYIEEPEAHLFPLAQSLLMEFLISSFVSEKNRRNLILTTHSPYIMSKLNVFLKAGQLARRRKRNHDLGEIVPRDCWLDKSQLSAYAIQDGKLYNILDDDGLIDAEYLDHVSESISDQFSELLALESEMRLRDD